MLVAWPGCGAGWLRAGAHDRTLVIDIVITITTIKV